MQGSVIAAVDLLHAYRTRGGSDSTPGLGIISWFSTQKGLRSAGGDHAELMDARDLLLVVLGTGEPYYEGLFRSFAEKYPAGIAVKVAYDETMAHKI